MQLNIPHLIFSIFFLLFGIFIFINLFYFWKKFVEFKFFFLRQKICNCTKLFSGSKFSYLLRNFWIILKKTGLNFNHINQFQNFKSPLKFSMNFRFGIIRSEIKIQSWERLKIQLHKRNKHSFFFKKIVFYIFRSLIWELNRYLIPFHWINSTCKFYAQIR